MTQKGGYIVHRVIGRCGITFMYLIYDGPELVRIRAALQGQKAQIIYDPEDLGHICVWDPSEDRYVEVTAPDQEYTHGLSLSQHRATLKQRREQHHAILAATRQATRRLQDSYRRNGAMQAEVSAPSFISVSEDGVGEQNVKEDDERESE